MMQEEVRTLVRAPIQPIADAIRFRLGLKDTLDNVRIEADAVVFEFKRKVEGDEKDFSRAITSAERVSRQPIDVKTSVDAPTPAPSRRRRRASKRIRMRTQGWPIVGKIVTSKGQTAVIYKPLVDALEARPYSPTEQRAIVGRILRENGNDPTESSIEYFLQSTLEYLATRREGKE